MLDFWSSAPGGKCILQLSSSSHIFHKTVPHGHKQVFLSDMAHRPVSCHFGGIQSRFPLVAYRYDGEDEDRKSIKDLFGFRPGDSLCILRKALNKPQSSETDIQINPWSSGYIYTVEG
jgi:hypothetical protein